MRRVAIQAALLPWLCEPWLPNAVALDRRELSRGAACDADGAFASSHPTRGSSTTRTMRSSAAYSPTKSSTRIVSRSLQSTSISEGVYIVNAAMRVLRGKSEKKSIHGHVRCICLLAHGLSLFRSKPVVCVSACEHCAAS